MDPKVNGQMQHEWGWRKAIYLFLGGAGAGAYVIAAVNSFTARGIEQATTVGLWIAFPVVAIGSLFLLTALGAPTRAVLAANKQGTSWISRGVVILVLFMGLSFVHLIMHNIAGVGENTAENLVAAAGIVFAVGTMAYTGILLSAAKGIPFWSSGIVPVVFVTSALVSGQFAVMVGMVFAGAASELMRTMALEAAALILLEVLGILFFLQAARRMPDSRESAERLVRKNSFVVGYVVLGTAVPLLLALIGYASLTGGGMAAAVVIAAVLALLGRLLLRRGILACGALPTLNIAGFEFRRIARPKEPKPGIGLLPPQ